MSTLGYREILPCFAWVVEKVGPGWLTCDDGSGEVADFVHIAPDETLTLLHVKERTMTR